jgi:hypothetical protein
MDVATLGEHHFGDSIGSVMDTTDPRDLMESLSSASFSTHSQGSAQNNFHSTLHNDQVQQHAYGDQGVSAPVTMTSHGTVSGHGSAAQTMLTEQSRALAFSGGQANSLGVSSLADVGALGNGNQYHERNITDILPTP